MKCIVSKTILTHVDVEKKVLQHQVSQGAGGGGGGHRPLSGTQVLFGLMFELCFKLIFQITS